MNLFCHLTSQNNWRNRRLSNSSSSNNKECNHTYYYCSREMLVHKNKPKEWRMRPTSTPTNPPILWTAPPAIRNHAEYRCLPQDSLLTCCFFPPSSCFSFMNLTYVNACFVVESNSSRLWEVSLIDPPSWMKLFRTLLTSKILVFIESSIILDV